MFRFRRLRTRIIVAFAILVTFVQAIAFVLVNAANDQLQMGGGVAAALRAR